MPLCDRINSLGGDNTVIICDSHYRSAISAIRSFAQLGEKIVAVTTDKHKAPPAFSSVYISEKYVLPSVEDEYLTELLKLCGRYDMPMIFPVGKFSLDIISKNLDSFSKCARLCVATSSMLDNLNDKKWVKKQASSNGIKIPRRYGIDEVDSFPVVVKPYCGEQFALKAADRYKIVHNREELQTAYDKFKRFDDEPIIEEYIDGQGVGVSVLFNNSSQPLTVFCHKRLTEYPTDGGPSAYLVTFYDDELVDNTISFFKSIGFVGIAMAEYKLADDGYYLLEVNPRIWGSFPATVPCKSNFVASYIKACNGESDFDVRYNKRRVKLSRGLILATLSYVKHLRLIKALKSFLVLIDPFIPDALTSIKDPIPSVKDFFRR